MFFRFQKWFKLHRRNIILALLFFLIATISFGLGFLTAREANRAPIIIQTGNGD